MDKEKKLKAVCYGEVLWDVFGTDKKIGGAPLNVALRMQALGCDAAMISSVGDDADGEAIIDYVKKQNMDTGGITKVLSYPTGLVQVFLNKSGSASYKINYPSAWDKIVLNTYSFNLAANADVLIYGSLICRDAVSKQALKELIAIDVYKVFDVNLRKPHYTYTLLEELINSANFVKFNNEELLEIATAMGSAYTTIEDNMAFMAQKTNTKGICVTKGSQGAVLLWNDNLYHNNGYPVTVADTVGSGDSFLASLLTQLLTGKDPQKAIDFACAVGALVASKQGANPHISYMEIEAFINRP